MTTEVTQAMYTEFLTPPYFETNADDHKPIGVNWYEAAIYANALSQDQGLEMCYRCIETNYAEPCRVNTTAFGYYECSGYTIVSLHEAELATRSGTTKDFWTGEGDDLGGDLSNDQGCDGTETIEDGEDNPLLSEFVWYCGNYSGKKDVALKPPNGFGLYDMQGNFEEWTHDKLCDSEDYPNENAEPCMSVSYARTKRGGGANEEGRFLSSSYKSYTSSDTHLSNIGFRLRRRKETQ